MYVATMSICRRKWFFISFFLSVPRTFGEYCRYCMFLHIFIMNSYFLSNCNRRIMTMYFVFYNLHKDVIFWNYEIM